MSAELQTKTVALPPKVEDTGAHLARVPGVGSRVGRYQLVHRLGHGGMATVYLARSEGTAGFEKLVAVKIIHPHLAREPEFVEMFLDEARIASRLHHPNVVEILDLDQSEGVFYMVMEYVAGETLAALLRALQDAERAMPVAAALQATLDACEGLGAAHALTDASGAPYGLVHRDVSPHNLLVAMDGWVKVVDFGIMKAAGKRSNTLTGQLRGKLPYMSPEQARGEGLDRRTDIFALGAVLWEMLMGRRLFEGENEATVLDAVLACDVPDVSHAPPAVQTILRRALAPSRADRYARAEDMARDLRAALRAGGWENEPREELAELMDEFFARKVAYARAAAASSSGELPLPPPGASAPTSATGAPAGSWVAPPRPSPLRHWSLWLLLPLLGAGLAAATLALRKDSRPAPTPPPAAAPAEDPAPQPVRWILNTDPQGASVTLDGAPQEGTTPLEVLVPVQDDPMTVEFSLPGHLPRAVRLVPMHSANYDFVLQPMAPAPATPPASGAGGQLRAKTRPRPRKRPASAPGPKPAPDRDLEPMPDFRHLAKDEPPPQER